MWKRTHSAADLKSLRNQYHNSYCLPKNYFSSLVSSAADNPKSRLQTVSKLLHRKSSSPLPTPSPGTLLADCFSSFLQAKCWNFLPPATQLHHLRTFFFCYPRWCLSFHSCLKHRNPPDPVQLSNCPTKQSHSDPISTWLLKECSQVLVSTINNIVYLSVTSVSFIPLSRNPLSHHCLRNPLCITTGQSLTCLSFPK